MNATTEISKTAEQALGAPTTGGTPVPLSLSVTERAALMECEEIIREGMNTFFRVGCALQRIRDSKLYRERYLTFEEYCEREWDMSDRFARQLRTAADVVNELSEGFEILPATESQARPVSRLPREEWRGAWEEVLGTAQGKITASHVTSVVQRRLNRLSGRGTEMVAKGESSEVRGENGGSQISLPASDLVVDVADVSSKGQRALAQLDRTRRELVALQELLRPAETFAAADLVVSIQNLDVLQDELLRKERLKEPVEISRPENLERALAAREEQRRDAEAQRGTEA